MKPDLLYDSQSWMIYLTFFLLLIGAVELGFRIGRKAESRVTARVRAQISIIEGSLVGILGLLLGFTMSMAVPRFEVRKQLVLDEANAIGTSHLRTRLLPEPEGSAIRNLLRDYGQPAPVRRCR